MPKPFLAFLILLTATSPGEETAAQPSEPPAIKKLTPTTYQIGKVHLDQATREISFGAGLNMHDGLLEYLITTTSSDKVHETLFLTDIVPHHLQIAMKLLGIQESKELFEIIDEKEWKPTGKFPEVSPEVHAASLVDLAVEWTIDGTTTRVPIHETVLKIEWPEDAEIPDPGQEFQQPNLTTELMPSGPWLSTGSYLHEGRFKADVGGIIFGIFTSEQAVVNYPGKDRIYDDIWIPNKEKLPPLDTVVKIILKPHTKKS